jgi:hypothetical protein
MVDGFREQFLLVGYHRVLVEISLRAWGALYPNWQASYRNQSGRGHEWVKKGVGEFVFDDRFSCQCCEGEGIIHALNALLDGG